LIKAIDWQSNEDGAITKYQSHRKKKTAKPPKIKVMQPCHRTKACEQTGDQNDASLLVEELVEFCITPTLISRGCC
jgi:hypothetical protein